MAGQACALVMESSRGACPLTKGSEPIMSQLTLASARRSQAASAPPPQPAPESALLFWAPELGSASEAIAELCPHIDALSQRIAHLPVRVALTRPVVGQYLTMLKTLAAAWGVHTRPALLDAMAALVHVGDSIGQSFALEALSGRRADGGLAAVRVLDALLRRLAAPAAAFERLDADFSSYLKQMALASRELDADTLLVTQRLQADYVHAFLLSQQASSLQSKLDDARMREHAWWLLGPHAVALRQEICLHASALEGVRRQLDHLRSEQSATQAEADYLQSLLPSLSTYLAALDRMGAALASMLGGVRALGQALAALKLAMPSDPAALNAAETRMQASLPHWQALAATARRLPPRPLRA